MNFEYLFIESPQASIEIEDIGNTTIQAFNDEGKEYLLDISTEYGKTRIITFGGFLVDFEELENLSFNTYRINYDSKKLYKMISDFINKNDITQVFEITKDEFNNLLKEKMENVYGA